MAYKHSATSDGVYADLKEKILYLELPPGSSISEIETAENYNVSRTPVRDAFKCLEREGLLEIRPHIGTFVSLIDLNTVSDVLYTRNALEYAVLSDVSLVCDAALEQHVESLLKQQKDLLDSGMDTVSLSRAFIKCDNEFHTALFDAVGKKNLIRFIGNINCQYERFRTIVNFSGRDDLQKLYEMHLRIWDCIKRQDLVALKDCLNHHLYDGFSGSSNIVSQYPEYFKKSN
jgi:DNA-binding GntR family transcriptional regulator